MILGEKLTPAFIIKGVSKQGIAATNPKVIEQIAVVIEKVLNEFGPAGFPLQEAVAFAVYGCQNTNIKVREVSIKMIASIFKYVGEPIRPFLKDVKESTLKVINEEFLKTEVIKVVEPPKRQVQGEEGKQAVSAISMLDSLPRVDVSKELSNSKLITKLRDANWKIKKEGYDRIEEVINEANQRI